MTKNMTIFRCHSDIGLGVSVNDQNVSYVYPIHYDLLGNYELGLPLAVFPCKIKALEFIEIMKLAFSPKSDTTINH